MLYKTGASTLENNGAQGQSTISRNYSPVKDTSTSFGWRLMNQNNSSSTIFERNALLEAVTNQTAPLDSDTSKLNTTQQNAPTLSMNRRDVGNHITTSQSRLHSQRGSTKRVHYSQQIENDIIKNSISPYFDKQIDYFLGRGPKQQ